MVVQETTLDGFTFGIDIEKVETPAGPVKVFHLNLRSSAPPGMVPVEYGHETLVIANFTEANLRTLRDVIDKRLSGVLPATAQDLQRLTGGNGYGG